MSVDLSGLPELPDTGALRTSARSIRTAAASIGTECTDARSDWSSVSGVISCSYGNEEIHGAMRRMPDYGEGVKLSGAAVAGALEVYCDEIDALKSRYDAAVTDASVCFDTSSEDGAADEQDAQDEVNAVAGLLQAAEQRCADAITAADPGESTQAPDYSDSASVAVSATKDALERLRTREHRFTIARTVTTTSLDYSRLQIRFADGSTLTHERLALTRSSIRTEVTVRSQHPGVDTSRLGDVGEPPRWARIGGAALGVFDAGMTAWSAGTDEWNDDRIEHPEYSDQDRWLSAGKSAGLRTAGATVGGTVGASVGTAAGAALFGTLGSVVPVAGTAAGIAVGGFLGGVVGGFVGGTVGEGIGGFVDNLTDGESVGDAVSEAWDDLWG